MVNRKILFCEIAGIKYQIEYQYNYIEKMFRDYRIDEDTIQDRNNFMKISYTGEDVKRCSAMYTEKQPEYYIEYTCILDQIASRLPSQNMLLMHGATIEYDGKAYVFTAPSGTGKSTHIALWRKYLGEKVQVINGDKPEVSFDGENVYVHGAPWCGKEGWQINTSAPLAGICLIEQGKENKVERINPGKYIEYFICQFYIGQGNDEILKVIDLFSKMAERVPFYLLTCDISEDAARCSFEAMTGKKWNETIGQNTK